MVIAGLVALPDDVTVVPMKDLSWRIGQLVNRHSGLSMLAAAAAEHLGARLVVSSRDDGPGIRTACMSLRIRYSTVAR